MLEGLERVVVEEEEEEGGWWWREELEWERVSALGGKEGLE